MDLTFEALITETVDISGIEGDVQLMSGRYFVTLLHDGGRPDGAQFMPLGEDGQKPKRLTQSQYELLDGTPFFERA